MSRVLDKILTQKHKEVEGLKEGFNFDDRIERSNKSLEKALKQSPALIAEVKRASPAKGKLAEIVDPVALAMTYEQAGAAAISVLTDPKYFNGSIEDLEKISQALKTSACPILRKEFIIDPLQIAESACHGADAVLLIVAVLRDKTQAFIDCAASFGLEALVEVHTEDELKLALDTSARIIGVNNRNLDTLEVDLNTSLKLKEMIPEHLVRVSESGIHSPLAAHRLFQAGFHGLLVGEALVCSADPAAMIQAMRKGHHE